MIVTTKSSHQLISRYLNLSVYTRVEIFILISQNSCMRSTGQVLFCVMKSVINFDKDSTYNVYHMTANIAVVYNYLIKVIIVHTVISGTINYHTS